MAQIKIDGVGTVNVDDSFFDLSPDEQNEIVKDIIFQVEGKDTKDPGKEWDWISDVTGTIGAAGGAIAGGIFGGGVGALPGGVAGGAAGGAAGEWLEQKLRGEDDTGAIFDEGVVQGAWGLLPGGAAVPVKAAVKGAGRGLGKSVSAAKGILSGGATPASVGRAAAPIGSAVQGAARATRAKAPRGVKRTPRAVKRSRNRIVGGAAAGTGAGILGRN